MIPTVDYDVDGDGTTKVAIDILRRVKVRADALLDGAIFYDYQMQEGDNAEIIADKYYGSSQYHWIVLMMNNIIDHTYDFALNSSNFESYINTTYGSFPRASGVSVNLTSTVSGIESESRPTEVIFEPQSTITDSEGESIKIPASDSGNTGLLSGSFPAGNTTAIWISGPTSSDPFKNIDIDDTVHLFVPDTWYDQTYVGSHSGNIVATTSDITKSFVLSAEASIIPHRYVGGSITITSEGNGTTGITGNTRTISTYDAANRIVTINDEFESEPVANGAGVTDAWGYRVSFNASKNFPLISYTSPAKVVAKSAYRSGEVPTTNNPNSIWIPDENQSARRFQLNIETDSTTFESFLWDKTRDLVSIQTGIHHFEQDIYDDSGSVLLAEKVYTTQEQYVNTSVGTPSTKRFVSNISYEAEANEDKRTIQLLKKEYLPEFVEEFKTLMKLGV